MNELQCEKPAFNLIDSGFKVFPLAPNTKVPLKGTHGYKDATSNPETFFNWIAPATNDDKLNIYRSKINIGIVLDGLIVLDVDLHSVEHNGREALVSLAKQGEQLPPTYIEMTPHDGLHYFFKYDGKDLPAQQEIASGLEIRTDQIIVSPSEIDGKPYKPIGKRSLNDAAAPPQWLLDMTKPQKSKPDFSFKVVRPSKYKSRIAGNLISMFNQTVSQGGRNEYLTRVCGLLLSSTAVGNDALKTLLKVNNLNCVPPLADSEVIGIYKSILKHELNKKVVNR
ncbi:MAG: bifunctional DNA primase/polymerase [Liquorilactobacillus nagelii]|uniref:bifunctional DNA primase/polymerase n=1 Tax=Liquorilactobacillus nagelii TaxID=82688 RepID=UPI0039EC7C26